MEFVESFYRHVIFFNVKVKSFLFSNPLSFFSPFNKQIQLWIIAFTSTNVDERAENYSFVSRVL